MAWRCYRATSRCARSSRRFEVSLFYVLLSYICLLPLATEAGLYTTSDQILILTPDTVESLVFNSTGAVVVEFYATWCGHCVAFSAVWKSLARDVKEWKPAVDLAAIDCSEDGNRRVCSRFGITGYPSLKFFPAYSDSETKGQDLRGFPRDVRGLRHLIIKNLEKYSDPWPPACPPLEPASVTEVDAYFENSNIQYLALVFETDDSYVGREVTLDLLQYENIAVRRVLRSEVELVTRLGVTDFPSCYVYNSTTNYSRLTVLNEARSFYSYALQRLPGVVRAGKPQPVITDLVRNSTEEPWRPFNRTRVYMSDLESALHYSLRVELESHSTISGDALITLQQYISIIAKYFPGRPAVKGALKAVDVWLQGQKETITYRDFRAVLDSTTNGSVLPEAVRWVGCQGSRPQYRGYPCAMWTLFHVLAVQAEDTDALQVLQVMRRYVGHFFGCRPCAEHFERMAEDSLARVPTSSEAVLWLWSRHNRVNSRLAGALGEDPHFPKLQWPPPELCSHCHGLNQVGEHSWKKEEVLAFLQSYYSAQHILPHYLLEEGKAVAQQPDRRKARAAPEDSPAPTHQDQEEEEEEEEEEEPEGGALQAGEPHPAGRQDQTPPSEQLGLVRGWTQHRPSIVGLKLRQPEEDIVDLDSFVNQHYRAKMVRAEQEPASQLRRRVKRELIAQEEEDGAGQAAGPFLRPRGSGWMSLFSRLDVSVCALLYLLSCLCLLVMWLYVRDQRRLRRIKVAVP